MSLPPASNGHEPVTDSAHLLPAHASEPAPAGGSLLRKLIVLAILIAVVAFAVWKIRKNKTELEATNNRSAAAANRPTPVLTSAVQLKTVPVYLTALGTVTAYNTVALHSRVDGQLLKVNFQEGQAVHEKQLLIQIDPRSFQAALAQAQGQLAKDEAAAKNADAEARRYTALYQAGVISHESQQTQIANAGQSAGTLQADNAAIQAAKVNLSYTSIYSPINGIVGLRGVDVGNIVHASDATPLVTITQVHPISVIFTLPEDQLHRVQEAMHGGAKLAVDAYDRGDQHKIASGTLLTLDNQIDTTTGTAKLKAVFPNADDALYPNQFVNVRLVLQQRENALVIPSAAVQTGTNGTYVFVVRQGPGRAPQGEAPAGGGRGAGGKGSAGGGQGGTGGGEHQQQGPPMHVDSVAVHVDFTQGPNSILANGAVKAGDMVVIDGQEKLLDGGNVQPRTAPTAGTPGATGSTAPGAVGAQPAAQDTPGTGGRRGGQHP